MAVILMALGMNNEFSHIFKLKPNPYFIIKNVKTNIILIKRENHLTIHTKHNPLPSSK